MGNAGFCPSTAVKWAQATTWHPNTTVRLPVACCGFLNISTDDDASVLRPPRQTSSHHAARLRKVLVLGLRFISFLRFILGCMFHLNVRVYGSFYSDLSLRPPCVSSPRDQAGDTSSLATCRLQCLAQGDMGRFRRVSLYYITRYTDVYVTM